MTEPTESAGGGAAQAASEHVVEVEILDLDAGTENIDNDNDTLEAGGAADTAEEDAGDIDGAIKKLEAEAGRARQAKEAAENTLADKENRLAALRTVQRELDANKQAYGAAYDKLKRDEKAYRDFLTSEKGSLEKLLGPVADEVRKKAAALGDERKSLEREVDSRTTAATEAEAARDASKVKAKELSDRSGELKKLAATITARLALLKTRRDEITKASQAGQYALAYWLLTGRDYAAVLDREPKLIAPTGLAQALIDALDAQAKAEQRQADDERTVVRHRAELTDARKRLDDHLANGEARLRADLEQMATMEGDKPHA
ncbi:coiled-coil domain-containing protein [Couchioplanes caeruleus]|uniref:Uncharacterized protein n=2 Tax=Couchioplanes caeruleus TaxID=56438 RepID=A0A1K0GPA6_9ACTN|nr:hypothetical protein [Couchioplanes caeruleus]OJF14206.1 hypothetical protein BG844_11150 [Couchioplanes caeruleus subsp. caeruleus]ROP28332.1 hypothetical protein EDD30_1079 [Couchioplanes caeruleus]